MTAVPVIPEKHKLPGVCYALTDDGIELPVMDITNPAFAENPSPARLAALTADFMHFQKLPAFLRRLFSGRSIVMRGLSPGSGNFLGGMTTYVCKLGPAMLGRGYAGAIDRRVAGAIGSVAFRIRLQDMARLLADELAPALKARPGRPVTMLNIGGGPAMDSLNALILTRKEHPERLEGRRIGIRVLDLDRAGPGFGSRAVAALLAVGAPLHGLDVVLDSVAYDWTTASGLPELLGRIDADCVVVGSSEGGLFEYGTDEVILENLHALMQGTPADFAIVGSIMRDADIPRWIKSTSRMPLRIFKLEDFKTLVESAGWVLGRITDVNPIQRVVSLNKAR